MFFAEKHIRNQQISLPEIQKKNIQLFVKREDELHPVVSGNKFRKLKYNLLEAKKQKVKTLLTFGGAFSNHIVATAAAGKLNGFKTIGVIRGDELGKDLEKTLESNLTLRQAYEYGMEFIFISREEYRSKYETSFIQKLKEELSDFYLIPEGGTNEFAIKGCQEILTNEDTSFDYICCCVGTGGTISGLINTAKKHQRVLGFPALKGGFLQKDIEEMVPNHQNWELIHEYHFGGYAKYKPELIHFINWFKEETNVQLDPIYTGKMAFGVIDMIKNNSIEEGSKVLMIHTGGIQGIQGFNTMLAKKEQDLQIYL